jgi:hypothetical protein
MEASDHSILVSPWLSRSEALVLQSALEVLGELEERSDRRLFADAVGDVRTAARLNESAKITRERLSSCLISLAVYGNSPEAQGAIDAYNAGLSQVTP